MAARVVVGVAKGLAKSRKPSVHDATGMLHCKATPVLLVVFALIIGLMQIGMPNAACFVPQKQLAPAVKLIQRDCSFSLFYHPITEKSSKNPDNPTKFNNETAAMDSKMTEKGQLATYHHFPFVLIFQAAMFFISGSLWTSCAKSCGIPLDKLFEMAAHAGQLQDPTSYKHAVENLAGHVYATSAGRCCNRVAQTVLRCVQTLIFVFHGGLQMCFLSYMATGRAFASCGLRWIIDYYKHHIPPQMANFPRRIQCALELGGQDYSFDCTMTLNIFQERLIVFLWFWFAFITLTAVAGFISQSLILCLSSIPWSPGGKIVARYLKARRLIADTKPAWRFTREVLGPDGVTALTGISANGGDLVATDVVEALWNGAQPERLSPGPPVRRTTVPNQSAGGFDGSAGGNNIQPMTASIRYDDVDPYATDDLNLNMQKPLLYAPMHQETSFAV